MSVRYTKYVEEKRNGKCVMVCAYWRRRESVKFRRSEGGLDTNLLKFSLWKSDKRFMEAKMRRLSSGHSLCSPVIPFQSGSFTARKNYLRITNKMQRYTIVFITKNSLHVPGGSSAHHQELKTVYTSSGICRFFFVSYRYREWVPSHSHKR